jgi:hypothetical protein
MERIRGDARSKKNGDEKIRETTGKTTARNPTATTIRLLIRLAMAL